MTRTEVRRRKRRIRKIQQTLAWTVVILFEILVSAAPAAVTAAILIPLTFSERGRMAVGGEWLAIGIVFYIAYRAIHRWVCNRIFGEEA